MMAAERENEFIAALTACGREKDIPYFTGKKYGTPGHSIPEPFEMTYSDGTTATHFAGIVDHMTPHSYDSRRLK